jgi:hypothetical protein
MTSLAIRLREDLRLNAVNIVLSYLDISDSQDNFQAQKEKIQALVANIFACYSPKVVFYLPLPGKPDVRLPLDSLLKTPRPRVLQQGQKAHTCLFYAMKKIGMHIGKNPPETFKELRKVEKTYSEWRKGKTRIDKTFGWQLDFAQDAPDYSPITKDNIAQVLANVDRLIAKDVVAKVRTLYQEFSRSNFTHLRAFVKATYYTELHSHHLTYLSLNHVSSDFLYNSEWRSVFACGWEELDALEKTHAIDNCVFRVAYTKYGLKESSWHPSNPIQELGLQIEAHGPHVILGQFGRSFYEKNPFPTGSKIQGRGIYAWPPQAKRIDREGDHHGIVLVGANCDRNHVYFMDPVDPSDPKQPLKEKIYVISYENLRKNIHSLSGLTTQSLEGLAKGKYAIYGDPQLANL